MWISHRAMYQVSTGHPLISPHFLRCTQKRRCEDGQHEILTCLLSVPPTVGASCLTASLVSNLPGFHVMVMLCKVFGCGCKDLTTCDVLPAGPRKPKLDSDHNRDAGSL